MDPAQHGTLFDMWGKLKVLIETWNGKLLPVDDDDDDDTLPVSVLVVPNVPK